MGVGSFQFHHYHHDRIIDVSFDDLNNHLSSVRLHDLLAVFRSSQSHSSYGQTAGIADSAVSLKNNKI
jgi:hypothetical protein